MTSGRVSHGDTGEDLRLGELGWPRHSQNACAIV